VQRLFTLVKIMVTFDAVMHVPLYSSGNSRLPYWYIGDFDAKGQSKHRDTYTLRIMKRTVTVSMGLL